jgi:hypothetical protein
MHEQINDPRSAPITRNQAVEQRGDLRPDAGNGGQWCENRIEKRGSHQADLNCHGSGGKGVCQQERIGFLFVNRLSRISDHCFELPLVCHAKGRGLQMLNQGNPPFDKV